MANKTTSWKLAHLLLEELKEFEPFIWHGHAQSPSVYIHFNKLPLSLTHKLRVSNHPERERYGYKWQLRFDGVPPSAEQKPFSRYFDNTKSLVTAFKQYYSKVEENLNAKA